MYTGDREKCAKNDAMEIDGPRPDTTIMTPEYLEQVLSLAACYYVRIRYHEVQEGRPPPDIPTFVAELRRVGLWKGKSQSV